MPRPIRSQFATTEEYNLAAAAWHVKLHELAQQVDEILEEEYGIIDGGDLCYNLIESGVISEAAGVAKAARIVAMHLMQA